MLNATVSFAGFKASAVSVRTMHCQLRIYNMPYAAFQQFLHTGIPPLALVALGSDNFYAQIPSPLPGKFLLGVPFRFTIRLALDRHAALICPCTCNGQLHYIRANRDNQVAGDLHGRDQQHVRRHTAWHLP